MKHYKLDNHTEDCKQNTYKVWDGMSHHDFCKVSSNTYVFFYNFEIYIISYRNCLTDYDDLDFKMRLIKAVVKKSKKIDIYDLYRSQTIDTDFANLRKRNISLHDKVLQVHSIYEDMCGKEYAICSYMDFKDAILENFNIDAELDETVKYMTENGFEDYIEYAKDLISRNKIRNMTQIEVCKSISELVKTINKKSKEHDASKH